MNHWLPPLAGLLGLLLVSGLAVVALARQEDRGPVYSLAAVRADLDRDPAAWADRAVRVWAVPTSGQCFMLVSIDRPACIGWQPALLDAGPAGDVEPLPLLDGDAPPLLTLLRRLPLLGSVGLGPQVPHWGRPGVYRVQLRAVPCPVPRARPCYGAVLLDGGP